MKLVLFRCDRALTPLTSKTQAKRIQSLRSVFGERYPDPVRVLSVGQDVSCLLGSAVVYVVVQHCQWRLVVLSNSQPREKAATMATTILVHRAPRCFALFLNGRKGLASKLECSYLALLFCACFCLLTVCLHFATHNVLGADDA